MTKILPLAFLTLLWLVCSQCKTISNRYDTNALMCGKDAQNTDYNYIKVKGLNDDESNLGINSLLVTFLMADKTTIQAINQTTRHCIRIPKDSIAASITNPKTKEGAFLNLKENSKSRIEEIPLEKVPTLSVKSHCTERLVKNVLPIDFNFSQTSNLALYSIRLLAKNLTSGILSTLLEKKIGLDTLNLQDQLDVKNIPEGLYRLQISISNPFEDSINPPNALNEDCPFAVLRSPPTIKDNASQKELYKIGETIPIESPGKDTNLFECIEKYSNPSQALSCNDSSACRDPKEFTKTSKIALEKEGLFNVHYFSEDKVGNRSQVECKTLAITSNEPMISITWPSSKTQNFPHMIFPYNEVPIHIDATSSQLQSNRYEQYLECKVSAPLEKDTICMTSRCKGRSMSEFVPCNSDLRIGIKEKSESTNSNGYLNLTARINRNGEILSETSSKIWYDKSDVLTETLAKDENSAGFSDLFASKDGTGIAISLGTPAPTNTRLRYLTWDPNILYSTDLKNNRLLKYEFKNKAHILSQYVDRDWVLINKAYPRTDSVFDIKDPDKTMHFTRCQYFYADNFGTPWCVVKSIRYYFDGSHWSSIHDLFDNLNIGVSDPQQCSESIQTVTGFAQRDLHGSIVLVCNGNILIGKGKPIVWKKIPHDDGKIIPRSTFVDNIGRIWIRFTVIKGGDLIGYIDENEQIALLPQSELQAQSFPDFGDFTLGSNNQIDFKDETWNSIIKEWSLKPLSSNENQATEDVVHPYLLQNRNWIEYPIRTSGTIPFTEKVLYKTNIDSRTILQGTQNDASFLKPNVLVQLKSNKFERYSSDANKTIDEYLNNYNLIGVGISRNLATKIDEVPKSNELPEDDSIDGGVSAARYNFYADGNGNYLAISTTRYHVYRSNSGHWKTVGFPHAISKNLNVFMGSAGIFWILMDQFILRDAPSGSESLEIDIDSNDPITGFYEIKGSMFVISRKGLFRWNKTIEEHKFQIVDAKTYGQGSDLSTLVSIVPSKSGQIVMKYADNTSAIWDLALKKVTPLPQSNDPIDCVFKTQDDIFYRSNSNLFIKSGDEVIQISDSLPQSEQCFDIDRDMSFWFRNKTGYIKWQSGLNR